MLRYCVKTLHGVGRDDTGAIYVRYLTSCYAFYVLRSTLAASRIALQSLRR
jgi:hypothetical protein